ncbi:MAG: DUF4271 domain-containing protein [Saprospiraceae bacterium]|jgi:hypothetical protein|nr:DUF4271 domain-containing protein [Saprospiraceae bacterium]
MPLIRILSVLICLTLIQTVQPIYGQTQNPFELIKSKSPSEIPAEIADTTPLSNLINPFELRPGQTQKIKGSPGAPDIQYFKWIQEPNNSRINTTDVQSLLFWALLFLSFLLAIALNINRNVTIKLYRSLLNLNFLSLLYRESKEENFLIYYLLYGLYFIGISLFLYLSIIHFKGLREPVYILYITLFVLTIYSIRHISLKVLGLIYGVYKEADRYLFSIVIFSCIMAIILIPADFVITFVSPAIAQKSIYIIISLFAFLYLYRQLREIIFSANIWREHIFHFLLYLCTFEIAPLVLMFKFLERQGVF